MKTIRKNLLKFYGINNYEDFVCTGVRADHVIFKNKKSNKEICLRY